MRGVLRTREERIANDAYYTPQPLADEICRRLAEVLTTDSVWDPCAGDGAFAKAARKAWPRAGVLESDLPLHDFLLDKPTCWPGMIVSNPPYLKAEDFVKRALMVVCDVGVVAFLLRLSFLAGQRRLKLYEQHPLRYLLPITPRPSFTPDGKTDASEYAVFVWQRGYVGAAEILPHLRWRR